MKKIDYPLAYGFLDQSVDCLVGRFNINCNLNGIECSDDHIDLLKSLVKEIRDNAIMEAQKYAQKEN